ncbi:hypothetical protein QWJ90_10520 [Microbacterium oryzae]|uniref:hypothetical protein n=1 Tax=Microbacterium oryzae TaxID=743009 RepID=UPI0025AF80CE|nr:hypothetical protein [Microbacterium oryzae]MDN3311365.1 hypothetical protein [Microbacterium oryzae]
MSLLAEPARDGASSSGRSAPPGRVLGAKVIPVTLTCYQVAVGDEVRGYLCCASEGWECYAGRAFATAEPIGLRKTLRDAVRAVVG